MVPWGNRELDRVVTLRRSKLWKVDSSEIGSELNSVAQMLLPVPKLAVVIPSAQIKIGFAFLIR